MVAARAETWRFRSCDLDASTALIVSGSGIQHCNLEILKISLPVLAEEVGSLATTRSCFASENKSYDVTAASILPGKVLRNDPYATNAETHNVI
jgi:hypothetical protein